ncbi:hypothetical protein HDK90DRAFT_555461 [Phyllosticta capitalensis]|uniref:Uncharacterized protein n=1 Tax=Phyllosticta capitalensis TaxID=121624 RepID=A0ABR1YLI8_9PEZI
MAKALPSFNASSSANKRLRDAEPETESSHGKRTRVDIPAEAGTVHSRNDQSSATTDVSLDDAVNALQPDTRRDILVHFAEQFTSLRNFIYEEYNEEMSRKRTAVKDFDWQSKAVWRELYVNHKGLSGSREYDAAGGVATYIQDTVRNIAKEARRPSSFEMRANAISTLRKIGKSVALCGDQMGHEVKLSLLPISFDDAFLELVNSFSTEEKRHLKWRMQDKLEELISLNEDLFPSLQEGLAILRANGDSETNGDTESDGDLESNEYGI